MNTPSKNLKSKSKSFITQKVVILIHLVVLKFLLEVFKNVKKESINQKILYMIKNLLKLMMILKKLWVKVGQETAKNRKRKSLLRNKNKVDILLLKKLMFLLKIHKRNKKRAAEFKEETFMMENNGLNQQKSILCLLLLISSMRTKIKIWKKNQKQNQKPKVWSLKRKKTRVKKREIPKMKMMKVMKLKKLKKLCLKNQIKLMKNQLVEQNKVLKELSQKLWQETWSICKTKYVKIKMPKVKKNLRKWAEKNLAINLEIDDYHLLFTFKIYYNF